MNVYLAGPMRGHSEDTANGWRKVAATYLKSHGIRALSPLRGNLGLDLNPDHPLLNPQGVNTQNLFDIRRSDMMLVNAVGVARPSVGTILEIGYAYAKDTPVVLAVEDEDFHNEPLIRDMVGWRVRTLEAALAVVVHVLAPTDWKGDVFHAS